MVAILVGPTAVGKTETAIALAERRGAEIISADSRYLYRGLNIGTAKPTPAELARVPHHLIDVTTPDQPWSLAQFQTAAYAAIAEVLTRARLPLLVGGTGQYVRAVAEGWQIPSGEPQAALRAELEQVLARDGVEALARRLEAIDPVSAARIDLRNPRRVMRALEVKLTTGEPIVAQQRKQTPPYAFRWLGLTRPRPELYDRIDARVDWMLAAGLVDEVRSLAAQGYGWDLPAMTGLGYRQIGAYLRGECSLDAALQEIKRATRVLVRRQANWFKLSDPTIHWERAQPGVLEALVRHLA
jgi:tRNA dimethylallyltransferase